MSANEKVGESLVRAILCTIHQPSAILMQEFDRLLFMQRGGKTVYFGDLGEGCKTMIDYFESHGAHKCPADANPAEWMLELLVQFRLSCKSRLLRSLEEF